MKSIKKTKIAVICCMIAGMLIIGLFIYQNAVKPLCLKGDMNIYIDRFDEYSLELLETMYKEEKQYQGDEDWIRFYDQLPSDDYRDYVTITVSGVLKNRSFFNQDGIFGNLDGVKNEDKVIDQYPVVSLHYVNRMEEKDMNLIYFDIYCKGMTEKEIVEYVNRLSLNLYFGSKIRRNNVLKLDLENAQWREEG